MESQKNNNLEEDKVPEQELNLFDQLDNDINKMDEYMRINHMKKRTAIWKYKQALNDQIDEKEVQDIMRLESIKSDERLINEEFKDDGDGTLSQFSEDQTALDDELYRYIEEMIDMINTTDEKLNQQNMDMLVSQISQRLKEQGVSHEKQQIRKFLEAIKQQASSESSTTPLEKKTKLKKLAEPFYKVGYISYYTATKGEQAVKSATLGLSAGTVSTLNTNLLSTTSWVASAFVYTAQTGLNYRRYKKGNIDKREFWRRVKMNSVSTVGGLAGGAGGCAAGFAIGTAILPGIGSILGTVVGGLTGGFLGEKASVKMYGTLEQKIEESKKYRRERELEKDAEMIVSPEMYEWLDVLGVTNTEKPKWGEIQQAYLDQMNDYSVSDGDLNPTDQEIEYLVQRNKQLNEAFQKLRNEFELQQSYKLKTL